MYWFKQQVLRKTRQTLEAKYPRTFYWDNAQINRKGIFKVPFDWFSPPQEIGVYTQRYQYSLPHLQGLANLYTDLIATYGVSASLEPGLQGRPILCIDTGQKNFERMLQDMQREASAKASPDR
ncbi:MAG: hypothetical protein ACKVOE_04925 [Rickettsiales bacterium]